MRVEQTQHSHVGNFFLFFSFSLPRSERRVVLRHAVILLVRHLSNVVLKLIPFFPPTDTTSVADTRNNPSIGEGSVGGLTGSLSASGSHMDRLGAIRDNLSETASTTALAGASITGSLSGSAMVNYLNR